MERQAFAEDTAVRALQEDCHFKAFLRCNYGGLLERLSRSCASNCAGPAMSVRCRLQKTGALDLALWDLKAKALEVPLWQLLGGKSRNYLECYSTAFPRPRSGGTLEDAARACIDAGFRTYRYATDNPRERVVDRFKLGRLERALSASDADVNSRWRRHWP